MRKLVLPVAVVCCALGAADAAYAASRAPSGRHAAERVVKKRLARSLPAQRRVSCNRAARRAWKCRWRAASRPTGTGFRRCRGEDRVSGGRRLRVRSGRRTCARMARARVPVSPKPLPAKAPAKAAAPTAKSVVPAKRKVLFGFNDNAIRAGLISASDDAKLTQRVGADVHRLGMDWRWLEPQPGKFNWSAYDDIYREMTARGIKPLFILTFAPSWALDPSTPCDQWHYDCRMPPGRAHDADWQRVAAAVAKRYPNAAGIEIWNEPNETTFWQPGPDPARYAELLKLAYAAIKSANPSMKVLGGSASNRQYAEGDSITQTAFLQGMYRAGAKGSMDALSVHPYPWSLQPSLTKQSLDQARAVRNANGDSKLPLWVTEIGLSTNGMDRYMFSPSQQSSGLAQLYSTLAAMSDVQAIMVHTLLEPGGPAANRELGYGVLNPDRTPKPAYCALGALRGVKSCP